MFWKWTERLMDDNRNNLTHINVYSLLSYGYTKFHHKIIFTSCVITIVKFVIKKDLWHERWPKPIVFHVASVYFVFRIHRNSFFRWTNWGTDTWTDGQTRHTGGKTIIVSGVIDRTVVTKPALILDIATVYSPIVYSSDRKPFYEHPAPKCEMSSMFPGMARICCWTIH